MNLSKKEICPICQKQGTKALVKFETKNICMECSKALILKKVTRFHLKKYNLDQLKEIVRQLNEDQRLSESIKLNKYELQKNTNDVFVATKKIEHYIHFDDVNKKIAIPKIGIFFNIKKLTIYNYSDILAYELLEDNNLVSSGGIGRALIGGLLFGGVGAIVGSGTAHKHKSTCSTLKIKITLKNINNPVIYINFIDIEVKKDGILYKKVFPLAQETLSLLNIICYLSKNNNNNKIKSNINDTVSEDIKKIKKLLDEGYITQEDYDKKKIQLLNI